MSRRPVLRDCGLLTVLILHGTWVPGGPDADGGFFSWAERVPAGRRGRRPAGRPREGAPHPFQARPGEVRQGMLELCPALGGRAERTPWRLARLDIRVPSADSRPLHSPEASRGEV